MSLILTKDSIVKQVYQMTFDIHQIFVNNGIKYWAIGSTLLGAVRNEGLIPWEDSISFGVLSKDVNKISKVETNLNRCGYSLCKFKYGYRISQTNKSKVKEYSKEKCYSYPYIEVLPFRKFADTKYRLSVVSGRNIHSEEEWDEKHLFPVREYSFGEFSIVGPNKFKKYLDSSYGRNWNNITYNNDEKIKLYGKLLKPAEPYNKIKNRKCVKACLVETKKKIPEADYWMKKDTKTCSKAGGCYNNFRVKMGVYVVNCAMHKERYEKFKKFAGISGVKACRVPCVLGKKFDHHVMCEMIKKKLVDSKADMTTIEVSINMSHYNCWKKLVNSCQEYALILEDDVELKSDFIEKINLIMTKLEEKKIDDFSVLHIWNGNWAETAQSHEKIMRIAPGINIVKETEEYNAGAAAYIISNKYAKFLMKKFFPIKIPQDIMIGEYVEVGNHLSLKMKYEKKNECYISPLLDMECGGEGGTGTQTTQEHNAPTIRERWNCEFCSIN